MSDIFLQNMIESSQYEDLPSSWNMFDLVSFSKTKKLWDYQQNALKNAIKVLWKYYEDFKDYEDGENIEVNQTRKSELYNWYKNNGLTEKLDINLDKRNKTIYNLLSDYYTSNNNKISYKHFINRMSFWMATGSGKSLVIVKLIEIILTLIERKEIPPYDILILTHRDDLIEQFKKYVNEFNDAHSDIYLNLKELKEYPEVKRQKTILEFNIFYYRSDNLSDEQKEKIIDFKNYENNGQWYIILDEAHKGDKEDSKRQNIYSILSRNGFLFNFSATFIDPKDIVTCAFEYNLSTYINAGYGKHISILHQEIRAFKDEEDYSGEEKQKIVLKSLILLTYTKKVYKEIKKIQSALYHNPLLLTLVNSVNIKDADLKLFFREIEKIGRNEIEAEIFNNSIDELWEELKQEPEFIFEEKQKLKIDESEFKSITEKDILNYVYNADKGGDIEVLRRQSNTKELAFKLKSSDSPFALIKIGDISGWLKELAGYEIQERFEDESFFENLNKDNSEINILMGSRGFYEGWDSNRPNVVNFINIGMGIVAKKFILQSVGRGVRIEPIKDKRKRLLQLYNAKEIDEDLFQKIRDKVLPIETLFIFGTNRNALITVIEELKSENKKENEKQISLFENIEAHNRKLLIPMYKKQDKSLEHYSYKKVKFEISDPDLELMKKLNRYIDDDKVLLMQYNTTPYKIRFFRDYINKPEEENIFKRGTRNINNIDLIMQKFFDYLDIIPEECEGLKEVENEIIHYKNIKVYLEDINELQRKINSFANITDPTLIDEYVTKKFENKEITIDQFKAGIKESVRIEKLKKDGDSFKDLIIKYIINHYYFPVILTSNSRIDYIKHIIKTPSEVNFINDLEEYLKNQDNKFKDFDWWMFSKLDETQDNVFIPYYNPNINNISYFYPDFIFWLQKNDNYYIVFVDPKGTEYTTAYRKIDGYKALFEENEKERIFNYNGLNVTIKLLLRTDEVNKAEELYKQYWFDKIENIFKSMNNI